MFLQLSDCDKAKNNTGTLPTIIAIPEQAVTIPRTDEPPFALGITSPGRIASNADAMRFTQDIKCIMQDYSLIHKAYFVQSSMTVDTFSKITWDKHHATVLTADIINPFQRIHIIYCQKTISSDID